MSESTVLVRNGSPVGTSPMFNVEVSMWCKKINSANGSLKSIEQDALHRCENTYTDTRLSPLGDTKAVELDADMPTRANNV